jgi:hypothetical protein
MHAPPKSSYPIIEVNKLLEYDAVLFGIPTRYGNFPAQWKTFWDRTGGIWASGGYWGKYAGLFVSTATLGGGQESTAIATMSTLAHHGFIYVPLGYKNTFPLLGNLDEVHGGSAWGAGTFAVSLLPLFLPSFPILTNCDCRLRMVLVSPLRWSWKLRNAKGRIFGLLFLRSISKLSSGLLCEAYQLGCYFNIFDLALCQTRLDVDRNFSFISNLLLSKGHREIQTRAGNKY